ncbi:MAG: translocation/assembly module TamB domain-containing protein [Alkalilacustris sp.]
MRRSAFPTVAAPLALAAAFGTPAPVAAEDAGFLTRLLQDQLSGAGREVRISGFNGALSSRATIAELTIADDDGVWLTLRGAELNWNRGALFRRALQVNTLRADEIILERLPDTGPGAPPSPEVTPFSLPELPLSVDIGRIEAEVVQLGAPVLGQPVTLRLDGSAQLSGGSGATRLEVERTDGAEGRLRLVGSFSNTSRELALDLALAEGPEGIAATALGLPDAPALALEVAGEGPLSDFSADIALDTDGVRRLGGAVVLARDGAAAPQTFRADISGDVRPLFEAEYRDFFGPETRLVVAGEQPEDGRVVLSEIDLSAEQVTLRGGVTISPSGMPERLALTGRVAAADGGQVLLPLAGPPTTIGGLDLDVDFDAARGEDWRADITLDGLERPDLVVGRVALTGGGRIAEAPRRVDGALQLRADGLAPSDPDLADALGDTLSAALRVDWREGAPLTLEELSLQGAQYGLTGRASIEGQTLTGQIVARLDDLTRFSGLAGRPLSGAAEAGLDGTLAVLDGAFDVEIDVTGTDLAADVPEIDGLLAGTSRIAGGLRRDEDGTHFDDLSVRARGVSARVDGALRSAGSDLSAVFDFPDIAVLGPGYGGSLHAEARLVGADALQRLELDATGRDITAGRPEVDGLLAGESRIALRASLGAGVVFVERFSLGATTLAVEAAGRVGEAGSDVTAELDFADLSVLGPGWRGRLTGDARFLEEGGTRRVRFGAEGRDLAAGQPQLDGLLAGDSRIVLEAMQEDGALDIARFDLTTQTGLEARGAGRIAPERSDFEGRVLLADLGVLGPDLAGRLSAEGSVSDADGAQHLRGQVLAEDVATGIAELDRLLAGQTRMGIAGTLRDGVATLDAMQMATASGLRATATGRMAGEDITFDARATLASLAALRPDLGGRLGAQVMFRQDAPGDGAAEGARRRLELAADGQDIVTGIPEADTLLRGSSRITLEAEQLGERLRVRAARLVTPLLTADADATVDGTSRQLTLQGRLANLGALVPGFDGAATLQGTIVDADARAERYAVDLRATGPGGIDARIDGEVARDLTSGLSVAGTANLALVNRFADPVNIQGPVRFDLRLDGAPGLEALSGTVTTQDARVVVPQAGLTLEGIAANARLGGQQVTLDARAQVQGGGSVSADGTIGLGDGLPAALRITLANARLTDRRIYETRVSGGIGIDGPLTGGARITGSLALADTEVRIPSTGLGVGGYTPPGIVHVGESSAARLTRLRAGINGDAGGANGNGGNPFALDLTLSSPNRVFIRGRGLDAEMGGELRLTGTTADVIPAGEFTLIRGRLDILGRRFVLSDGAARMTGRFVPFITMTATTQTDGVTASILVEGEANELGISFQSTPELPEEEVVALILFGRGLDRLSPLQAAQLASAVATLAGRGGDGVVGGLRRSFGLDDLDVSTTDDGLAALRLGRYLTENVYTDVVVDSEGRSEVSINLDVSSSVTVRARTDTDGRSGVGVFFERDY